MISKFLVSKFIKDSENIQNEQVRNKYGYLAGIVGIFSNLVLFIIKFIVGTLSSSIAVTADAFNNFSDMASSIITMIGFKLASMPPDEEHPFGHGRLEYISALIVAFMVMFVGAQFTKSSIERILNPVSIKFEVIPFILLVLSIVIKFWLSTFNKFVGNKINSSALKAAAADALGDVFTSSCVVISFLLSRFTSIPFDGYIGILVSLAILYAGFTLVKETISPLLGEAPDPELVKDIMEGILSYEHIKGAHDLIVHNYGVGRCIASIHAEIPANIDIITIHEVIDLAEKELSKKLNIHLVIHMDPISIEDEEVRKARTDLLKAIDEFGFVKSIHDFRVVGKGEKKNLIFDVVVESKKSKDIPSDEEIKKLINNKVRSIHTQYNCIITVDKDFL